MMAFIVTWPGVLLGILSTIMIEAVGLIIYAIHERNKSIKMIVEEIKDEGK